MPYISPSLSPTRSFQSPAHSVSGGSGTSSPAEPASPSISTAPRWDNYSRSSSSSYNPYGGALADGLSSSATSAATSSSSASALKRPPHRHHSRSHSSDTLVSLGGSAGGRHSHQHYNHHHLLYPQHQASSSSSSSSSQPPHHRHAKSSKMTPDFIYVQPASPGPDEQPPSGNGDGNNNTNSSSSHYDSLHTSSGRSHSYSYPSSSNTSSSSSTTTSSNRPGLRRSSASSRQSAAAAFGEYAAYHSPSSPTAGDYGDVPPPRSSSSSSLSSQARRSRRQMSASADSSPRHSISYHTPLPRIADDETAYMTGAVAKGSPPITPVTSNFDASNGNGTTTRSGPTLSSSSTSPRQSRTSLPRLKSASMQPSFSDSALATSSSSASSVNNTSDDDSDNTKAAAKAALHSPLLQKHKPSWGELPVSSSLLGGNLSTAFQFGQSLPTTPNGSVHVGGGGGSNSASSGSSTPTPKAEKPEETAIAWGSASGNGSAPDGGLQLHALNDGESDRAEWGPPGSSSSSSTQPSTKSSTTTNASSSSAVAASELNGSGAGSGSGSGTSSGSSESSPTSTPASSASLPITGLPSPAAVTAGAGVTPTSGPLAPAAVKLRRPTHTKAFSERAESPFRLEFEANNHHNQNSTHPSTHSRMTGLRQREASEGSAPAPGASSTSSSSSAHLGQYNHGGLTVHTHHPLHHFQQLHSGSSRSGSHRPSPLPTPMLRKKSGELVKSSMKHDSRAKSAPTTPTGPKAVHFDEQLERVKLFLAQQKPTAVSRDGSPQETETEDDSEATAFPFPPMTTSIPAQITLVLPDFPKNMLPDLGSRDACLESLEIAADSRSLKGSALLRNIAFEKRLSIRFTFDDWQTVSEVTGEWQSTLSGGNIDRWTFRIKLDDMLARIEDKKLYLALRYTVGGRDIWDSNNGANYRAEFRKQAARSQAVVGGSRAARHEWAVTNAGQANERMADLRRELDRLVAGHEDDDFSSADELVISSNNGGKGFKYQHRFLGGESVPLAQAPASNTFSSRYDFGASLKQATSSASNPATSQAQHRNSPQTSHAVLDNPYFAAPNASEAMISSWRNAASVITQSGHHSLAPAPSPLSASVPATSNETVSPKSQHQSLYADDIAPVMTTTVIGGMPATTFIGGAEPSASTPPASFSGADYYPRTEHNGVISQDFGLPNFMSYMNLGNHDNVDIPSSTTSSPRTEVPSSASSSTSTAMPGSYFPAGDPISSASSSTSNSASNSTTPSTEHSPTADFSGGAPLARQNRFNSFPPTRSFMMDGEGSASPGSFRPAVRAYPNFGQGEPVRPSVLMHGNRQHSASSLSDILDASLMDSAMDPRDTSIYSPAISPRSTSPPISSSAEIPGAHQRRPSPPPRPISPDDLLSPSPSSASTDTSISTPQSPGGSPPLRMYSPFIASGNGNGGRPEMGSDTYFNFVHRYCWGNGDTASSSSSSSSTSTALGLAGLNPTTFEAPTPRRATPPSSCSASLLSSPTQSQSGSRTPSPKNGSPTLETVQRMEAKGYMNGPPTVQI